MFSYDDDEMVKAKTGNWFVTNPQRARSNNSAILLRDKITKEEFHDLMQSVKEFGEPGFIFSDSTEFTYNPCQPAFAPILTPNGLSTMGDIKEGDLIWSKSGWTTVIKKWSTGFKDVYNYKTTFGAVPCTENHRLVSNGIKIEAKDCSSIDVLAGNYTEVKIDPSIVMDGLVIGDGSIHKASKIGNQKLLYIGNDDQDYFTSEVSEFIRDLRWSKAHSITTNISESELTLITDREIPSRYVYSDINTQASFLRGLFSANGSVTCKRVTLKATSFKIIKDAQLMLSALGIRSYFTTNKPAICKHKNGVYTSKKSYDLNISTDIDKFSKLIGFIQIYKNNKLESVLANKQGKLERKSGSKIIRNEFLGNFEVFDITVDNEEHTYWSGGHNISNCVEIGKLPITAKGISGWQGCVTGDTKLITKESIVNIKDTVGNEIEIWNGEKWSKVIPRITGKNRNDFYRVTFSDGSFLDCTSNHKFLAKPSGKGNFEIIETKDLMARKNSVTRNLIVPRAEIKYTSIKNNIEYAYEYGFILGDGTCTNHNTETLTIRRPWATLYECSGKNNLPLKGIKLSEGIRDGSKFTRIYFDDVDKYFAHKLKYENGLPEEIFSWSRKSIIDFIAGWIDSDGTKASNGFRIYGQENKLRDLQLLFTKLGISSSINLFSKAGTVTNKTTRRTDLYFIQVSDTKDLYSNRIVLKSKPTFAKAKYQNIVTVEKLNIIEDSYCFDENEKHCGVFNNILTKQCNLNEINGGACTSKEIFFDACKAAAILGTLQAGYTNFKYLTKETKEIFEREALLGVSVTGWMNNPDILFDEEIMREGAEIVKATNKIVAEMIGIRPAARTTCVKPSGNASVLLGTASGIHGEHAPRYLRNVQMNKESEVVKLIKETNPLMVEESVWSATKSDYIISFPLESKQSSVYKNDLLGIKQLEYVKLAQQNWIEYGTNRDLCTDTRIRHNVSNTIVVDDWDAVEEYVFENRKYFAGISFLGMSGDKDYNQAPFTTVLTAAEILNKYGDASMFASGLLVEGLDAFNQNLWLACDTVMGFGLDLTSQNHENMLQRDFVDRAIKFAHKYFNDNLQEMSYCLKDVYLLHKWNKITMNQQEIDWIYNLEPKDYVDVNTLGAIACSGGACELTF